MDDKMDLLHAAKTKSWQIPHRWVVAGGVLSSMTIQLLLVYGGAVRHRSAHWVFTAVVWLAYVSSDSVAESALGSMFHSSDSAILFAIWSPLLLLHLGGPDTITAYSLPDNQLWLRHLVNMIYQTIVAVYVLCFSIMEGHEWHLVGAALLVFFAGCSKYTERTCALCFADRPKIVRSTRNIYVYMQSEHWLSLPPGDEEKGVNKDEELHDVDKYRAWEELHDVDKYRAWEELPDRVKYRAWEELPDRVKYRAWEELPDRVKYRAWEELPDRVKYRAWEKLPDRVKYRTWEKLPDRVKYRAWEELPDVDKYRFWKSQVSANADQIKYQYIVVGEEHVPRNGRLEAVPEQMVTVNRVWEHERQQVTENYILCVSHALFKMYKRRLVGLRLHEASLMKTRRFFLQQFNPNELFRIVELELKFLYDYLFSKSSGTAFSRGGVAIRVLNTSALGLALFLVGRGLREKKDEGPVERMATYILLFVAIGVEVVQLSRLLLSDWSVVWLICADIRRCSQPGKTRCNLMDKLIPAVIRVVGWGRKFKFGRGKYWKNQIEQLSYTDICFSTGGYPLLWKVSLFFLPVSRILALPLALILPHNWYMAFYMNVLLRLAIKAEPVEEEFKRYFFDKVKETSDKEKPMEDISYNFQNYLTEIQRISNKISEEVEDVVIETQEGNGDEKKEAQKVISSEIQKLTVEEKKEIPEEIQEQWAEEKKEAPAQIHELMVEEKMEKPEDISSDIQEGMVDEKREIPEETSKMEEKEIHEQMVKKLETQQQMGEEKVGKPEETSKVEKKEIPQKKKPSLFELPLEEKKKKLEERNRLLRFRGREKGKGAPRTLALEDLLLAWHVSTAILEKLHGQSRDADVRKNVRLSKMVSNYCIYMIVSCPHILPVHPDNARKVYTDVFSMLHKKRAVYRDVFSKIDDADAVGGDARKNYHFGRLEHLLEESHTLQLAKGIVKKYHGMKVKKMWEKLADQWAKLFMYLALFDKSAVHEEQLTKGGEFITLIWVIMGHIGLAEATYLPSAMKIG